MVKQKNNVFRAIDANANRAGEGLRVIEDFARFVLDNRVLSSRCKHMRHELAECMQAKAFDSSIAMRDSVADVGRTIQTAAEYDRPELTSILKAAFARVEQATRSLEEFSKVVDVEVAKQFESIRYRVYQLELSFYAVEHGFSKMADSLLYVLIDAAESESSFREKVAQIIRKPECDSTGKSRSGADIVQLRDKSASTRMLIDRCRIFREVSAGTPTLLIVNDRADIAATIQADGVHLGQDDLNVHEARAIVGPDMLIGVSTHNAEQVEAAVDSGANYIGVGPTFESQTKSFSDYAGLDLLRAVSDRTSLPAFAIGGICAQNISDVIATGFKRVAVSASVWRSNSPRRATELLQEQLMSTSIMGPRR